MESLTIYCQSKEEKEHLQKTLRKLSAVYDMRTAELVNNALKDYYKTHKKEINI